VRYIESLWAVNRSSRLAPSQTKPRTPFERHCALLKSLPAQGAAKSDLQLLRESHRFLRCPEDDDGSWEARLAQRYYDRLFREYVICDLAGYKQGNIGLRWRTEAEVRSGRGQFSCGHRACSSRNGLRSFEVDFKYREAGLKKRTLVKARLCEECAYKLHYRRIRAARRRLRREGGQAGAEKEPPEAGAERTKRACKEDAVGDGSEGDEASAKTAAGATSAGAGGGPAAADVQGGGAAAETAEARRLLEGLAWRGPDPEARAREDDFDEYLQDLFM